MTTTIQHLVAHLKALDHLLARKETATLGQVDHLRLLVGGRGLPWNHAQATRQLQEVETYRLHPRCDHDVTQCRPRPNMIVGKVVPPVLNRLEGFPAINQSTRLDQVRSLQVLAVLLQPALAPVVRFQQALVQPFSGRLPAMQRPLQSLMDRGIGRPYQQMTGGRLQQDLLCRPLHRDLQ